MADDPYRVPQNVDEQPVKNRRLNPFLIAVLIAVTTIAVIRLMGGSKLYGVLVGVGVVLAHLMGRLFGTPQS